MTQTTAASTATAPSRLRRLYSIRVVFSVVWVVLVFATTSSLVSADRPTVVAGILLSVYPLWDVVATLLERRIVGRDSQGIIGTINIAMGLAATVAMIVAVFSTVGAALLVFGLWALLAGALQLVVAIRRRRTVGAQWPMMLSGGISVIAGASFAAMSASATSTLSSVAGYSAFGAFWFLVSVVALTVRGRRAAA